MNDLILEAPATEASPDATPAATPASTKSDIASDIRSALKQEPTSTDAPKTDLRDGLRSALEAATKPATAQPGAETQKPVDGQPRAADGKFAPKPAEVDAAAPKVETAPSPEIVSPSAWKRENQARYHEVPEWAREEIERAEYRLTKQSEKYQSLKSVEPVLDYAAQIAPTLNVPVPALVESWARIQNGLLNPQTRAQTIDWLSKQYPVPQQAAQQAQQPAQDDVWIDPEVKALRDQLSELNAWKQAQEQERQSAVQRAQQEQQQQRLTVIEQFGNEKGPDGQPLRPHLDAVSTEMAAFIASIKAAHPNLSDRDVLQQAYDRAVWGNPDLRAKMLEAHRIAQEKETADKARTRAQAAARSAVSPASSSPQGPAAAPPLKGDIRAQMHQVYQQLRG